MPEEVFENEDKIEIKQKKGTWRRFVKLFAKCNLPWLWLVAYVAVEISAIHIGINETDYTAQLFSGDTDAATLIRLIAFIVLNLIATNIVVLIKNLTSARINRNMRNVVLQKVMKLPMSFFKDSEPSETIFRIVNNSIVIESTIMLFIIPIAMTLYKSAAIFKKVFDYDWRLSLVLIGFIPLNIFIAFIFGRINYSLSERDAAIQAGLTQRLAQLVTNIPLAKVFAKESEGAKDGEEMTQRLYKINIKSSWLDQVKSFSETALDLIQALVIVLVGVLLLQNGDIDKRSWISFFMFSSLFSGAVNEFMMYWNNIKTIQGGADRIAEIMDAPQEDINGEECKNLSGDIVVSNLQFAYDESKQIFQNVDCVFKDNCATALLGVSGCGKTTLINLINRLYNAQSGDITIGSKSIYDYALDQYRANFFVVSQKSMLFYGSIRENVCYGNENVTDDELIDALKKAGAYDFVMQMPNGVDSLLDEYGTGISGGQRQRLAVARAMLSNAHYIILDEPVSAMDAIAANEIMTIFDRLKQDHCLIIIAHTPAAAAFADEAVVIENGMATSSGSIEELKHTNTFLAEFFKKEADDE